MSGYVAIMTADLGEMRELILPTLRADCEMHENYTPRTDEPVTVPVWPIRGSKQRSGQRRTGSREWRNATSSEFSFIQSPGDHMYLVNRAQKVLELIEAKPVDG